MSTTRSADEHSTGPLDAVAGRADAFERAAQELQLVGLGERLSHYPAQLSGGEQQRVAIARALAPDPAILVADEPTGNLDEANGTAIADLLFALKRERGATLVLVTHDAGLAARCDRTIRLRSGHVEDVRVNDFSKSENLFELDLAARPLLPEGEGGLRSKTDEGTPSRDWPLEARGK